MTEEKNKQENTKEMNSNTKREKTFCKKSRFTKFLCYSVLGVIILLPILLFILKFYSLSITESTPNDWAIFGTYIGGIYTFLSVIALIILTYLAMQINSKIANVQIKKDIYQVYFHQLNNHFFNVLNEYGDYELNRNDKTANRLNVSLFIFKKTIENLKDEANMLYINELSQKTENLIKSIDDFIKHYRKKGDEERKEMFENIVKYKKELIKNINDNLKA